MQIRQEFKVASLLDDAYAPSVNQPLKEIKDKLDYVINRGTSYLDFRKKELGLNYPSGLESIIEVDLGLPDLVELCSSLSVIEADYISSIKKLVAFFTNQWELRRKSNLAYPNAHKDFFNPALIECAEMLAGQLKTDRYRVLMPTLKVTNYEVLGSDLSDREWMPWHFVLADDDEAVIDVLQCLKIAEVDDKFFHHYLVDGQSPKKLSESERQRVINHSKFTKEYYAAIQAVLKMQKDGPSIGAMVHQLVQGLEEGGETVGDGDDQKAGPNGHKAIEEFYAFLKVLTADERELLFNLTASSLTVARNFKIAWYRLLVRLSDTEVVPEEEYKAVVEELARPENATDQVPCIELIGGNIDTILKANLFIYNIVPSSRESQQAAIEIVIDHRTEKELALRMALESKDYAVSIPKEYQSRWFERVLDNPDIFIALFQKGYIRNSEGYQSVLAMFSEENQQHITTQLTLTCQELIASKPVALTELESPHASKVITHAFLLVCSNSGPLLASVPRHIQSMILGINDLYHALEMLPEVCRINFMISMPFLDMRYILDMMRNNNDLVTVLKLLSPEDRAVFLRMQWIVASLRDRNIIENGADLWQVLSLLPARKYRRRLLKDLGKTFLKACLAERKTFIAISNLLSKNDCEFLIKYLGFDYVRGYINNDEGLKTVLMSMDSKNWPALFNSFGAIINNESLLVSILQELNQQNQLTLLNLIGDHQLRLIINDQAKLTSILNAIPQVTATCSRLLTQLGKDHVNQCIANGGVLLNMLDALPMNLRFELKELLGGDCIRAKVKNFFTNQIIFSMGTQQRDAAWLRFLNHLGGPVLFSAFQAREEWVTFLKSLQEVRWDAFFTTLGDSYICRILGDGANLTEIVSHFPQQLPLLLTMIGDGNILAVMRDGVQLKGFLAALPQDLAYDLLMRFGARRVYTLVRYDEQMTSLLDIFSQEYRHELSVQWMLGSEAPVVNTPPLSAARPASPTPM